MNHANTIVVGQKVQARVIVDECFTVNYYSWDSSAPIFGPIAPGEITGGTVIKNYETVCTFDNNGDIDECYGRVTELSKSNDFNGSEVTQFYYVDTSMAPSTIYGKCGKV